MEGSEIAIKIEAQIVALLAARAASASICPSEVARALAPDWRGLMAAVREVAWQMSARGQLRVTQGARTLAQTDYQSGPIRLRRALAMPEEAEPDQNQYPRSY